MEEEDIGVVIGRASELRTKLSECIDRFKGGEAPKGDLCSVGTREDDDEEEEEESLANIRDAFESLEQQLSNLQALQQQQRYERESSLFQIDRSRKILLGKLKDYKGDDNLEVIHEALTFAGGSIDHDDDDLLLPPYPSHLPDLFVMDDLHPCSRFTSKYKLTRNGVTPEYRKSMKGSEDKQWGQPRGVRAIFGLVAKSVLTIVGVVSVLSLAGFKPMLNKDCANMFKIQDLFERPAGKERSTRVDCPPGKVLVIEEGQPRCLVKERIEVPFDLDVAAPKINYGFG